MQSDYLIFYKYPRHFKSVFVWKLCKISYFCANYRILAFPFAVNVLDLEKYSKALKYSSLPKWIIALF